MDHFVKDKAACSAALYAFAAGHGSPVPIHYRAAAFVVDRPESHRYCVDHVDLMAATLRSTGRKTYPWPYPTF